MKASSPLPLKKPGKSDKERKVLLGLVDYYLKTGKPVGSNSLKEAGFEDLSAATIRNYFARLEEEGYLSQAHSSSGRIPTHLAYRFYAHAFLNQETNVETHSFQKLKEFGSREIAAFLQEAAELLSHKTQCAVFLSAPRFDQDFIVELKLLPLDHQRGLCVLISDFGVIQTELIYAPVRLSSFLARRIESYFHWKLTGHGEPENLTPEEEAMAQELYRELMLRYIVGYSNMVDEDIHRTGFSRLLQHEDFRTTSQLSASLSLFENIQGMRLLLKETRSLNQLKFWIGEDLSPYTQSAPNCAVLAIPYHIHQTVAGSVGILGPTRLPYRELFFLLRQFSEVISETLTRIVYKFKISFRQPGEEDKKQLQREEHRLIGQSRLFLLES